MAMNNKARDMTPFDMGEDPAKQNPLLMPVIWGASFLMTRKFGLRIDKVNMGRIKPPFLVLATHQGFSDYYIAPLALFPHRALYISDVEGFAAFGKKVYRAIGCIGKRRYVADINVMRHVKKAVKNGQSVVIYPESRHSNIGITSEIPNNMGRLVKHLGIPLVILSVNGSYLANPFWNEEKTRKVPIRARLECVLGVDQIRNMDADSIQSIVQLKLKYDEYDYQHKTGFLIRDKDRAEGMEMPLYQCISCGAKYSMSSAGAELFCRSCGRKWRLSEYGWLVSEDDGERIHPPEWYRKLQDNVRTDLADLTVLYREYKVYVEALPNEKGFVALGEGRLKLNRTGFILECNDVNGKTVILEFPHRIRESVQTEYNYKGRGKCIILSTKDCCYYIYSDEEEFQPTELQFIGEELYRRRAEVM